MSGKEEKKDKAPRPRYGMGSNVLYMLRLGREVPGLLFQRVCLIAVGVTISVAGLYMSPTLLRILEKGQSLKQLLAALAGFVLVLVLTSRELFWSRPDRFFWTGSMLRREPVPIRFFKTKPF